MDDPLAELRALRDRLAHLEAIAMASRPTTGAAPMDLGTAVSSHYGTEPPDRAQRDLENVAHGWQPDPQSEEAVAAHLKDPAGWEAAQRSMGGDLLTQAMYEAGRSAAIALGRFTPKETK